MLSRPARGHARGGALKEGRQVAALPGGEVGTEVPADRLPVDRPGVPQRRSAGRGENGEAGPPVGRVGLPLGQPGGGQLADHPAHPGSAEHRPLAQLGHPQPASGRGVELQQHVIPGQAHLAGRPQVLCHSRHQPAARPGPWHSRISAAPCGDLQQTLSAPAANPRR
jgi:hypothetical protein